MSDETNTITKQNGAPTGAPTAARDTGRRPELDTRSPGEAGRSELHAALRFMLQKHEREIQSRRDLQVAEGVLGTPMELPLSEVIRRRSALEHAGFELNVAIDNLITVQAEVFCG